MLKITILGKEFYDTEKEEFFKPTVATLELEHSLVSLSKWESIHEKPFLADDKKTTEETLSYIECMILTESYEPDIVKALSDDNLSEINTYINAKMTATWFNELQPSPKSNETITAELIYYWMTLFNIPFECENWHLNRLFTLIKICNLKNQQPKKMSKGEIYARNKELNAQRRKQLGTRG